MGVLAVQRVATTEAWLHDLIREYRRHLTPEPLADPDFDENNASLPAILTAESLVAVDYFDGPMRLEMWNQREQRHYWSGKSLYEVVAQYGYQPIASAVGCASGLMSRSSSFLWGGDPALVRIGYLHHPQARASLAMDCFLIARGSTLVPKKEQPSPWVSSTSFMVAPSSQKKE